MTLYAARRGRPRKVGVPRDAKGRIAWGHDRERPDSIKQTVLDARLRQQLGVNEWQVLRAKESRNPQAIAEARKRMDDPFRGYALGRLVIASRYDDALGITEEQHEAGVWFANLIRHMARIENAPSMTPKSIAADMVAGGISNYPEDSEEWVADIKRRFRDVYGYIYRAERDYGPIFEALVRILREDLDVRPDQVGALRIGLNAINLARGA